MIGGGKGMLLLRGGATGVFDLLLKTSADLGEKKRCTSCVVTLISTAEARFFFFSDFFFIAGTGSFGGTGGGKNASSWLACLSVLLVLLLLSDERHGSMICALAKLFVTSSNNIELRDDWDDEETDLAEKYGELGGDEASMMAKKFSTVGNGGRGDSFSVGGMSDPLLRRFLLFSCLREVAVGL
jgi:hypothetical protein